MVANRVTVKEKRSERSEITYILQQRDFVGVHIGSFIYRLFFSLLAALFNLEGQFS